MPIMNSWKDEAKRILYVEFVDNWTWEEYHNSMAEALAMIAKIDHHFVQLIDMRNANAMPANTSAVPQIMRGRKQENQDMGITVIVGAETIVRVIVNVFEKTTGQAYPKRYLVESIEEGLDLIAKYFAERDAAE